MWLATMQLKLIIINICLNKHTNMLLGQPKSPDYEPGEPPPPNFTSNFISCVVKGTHQNNLVRFSKCFD